MKKDLRLPKLLSVLILLCAGVDALGAPTVIDGKSWDLTTYKIDSEFVTEMEAYYTFRYTDDASGPINRALREGKAGTVKKYAKTILNVASLINKSRGKPCTFYRYFDGEPTLVDRIKTRGQIFIEPGFFSATAERSPDDEGLFSQKKYVIEGTSLRCPEISEFSRYQGESEVLFPPGTEFVVTKDRRGTTFYVKEAESAAHL